MGTDTCGSTRTPAAYNNLVSLRGTQGLVSRSGIFPLAPTQDIAGPLARTVSDVAIIFDVIAGYDPADPQTSASDGNIPGSYTKFLQADGLQGARIGQLNELLGSEPEDEEVADIILRAAADMKGQGATIVEIEIPDLDDHQGGYMSRKEFKFAVNDYLAAQKGAPVDSLQAILDSGEFHPEMEPRLRGAQAAVSLEDKEYLQMLANRNRLSKAILDTMEENNFDAILYPTMRRKPALIGESLDGSNCFLSSRSGLPAITVPAGFTDDGLPVGLELLGRAWDEATLFKLAYAYEQATHHRRPPEATPPLTNY
jgi:Asp-tRNA(Asn)/Glu-tRNA(Gln) amidotransferase A subunit family amidase